MSSKKNVSIELLRKTCIVRQYDGRKNKMVKSRRSGLGVMRNLYIEHTSYLNNCSPFESTL